MRHLTVQETADWLGLKVPTIRKMIANHQIDVLRINRAVRISEETVRKLIARNTIPARTR